MRNLILTTLMSVGLAACATTTFAQCGAPADGLQQSVAGDVVELAPECQVSTFVRLVLRMCTSRNLAIAR